MTSLRRSCCLALSLGIVLPFDAQAQAPVERDPPAIVSPRLRDSSPGVAPAADGKGKRLADSIAAAAHVGIVEQGRQAATSAVLDCQRGDYPGGGLGLLSLPLGRSTARTDHCFR